jgi:AAA domain
MGCIICLDDDVEIAFRCLKRQCAYKMCRDCLQKAFEARNMLEALCGPGAIRHIEDELRSKVEYDIELKQLRRERSKVAMEGHKDRANELFTALSEQLCMRCPRCKFVFDEYDGCNALICANVKCKAAICAVCLEDCGVDAHQHVGEKHGDVFNKDLFYLAKEEREALVFADFLLSVNKEPLEVRELVKILYEKLQGNKGEGNTDPKLTMRFLNESRIMLRKAVRDDRRSLLAEEMKGKPLERFDISPRSEIPMDYMLVMTTSTKSQSLCTIELSYRQNGHWIPIDLPNTSNMDEDNKVKRKDPPCPDSLINIKSSLQWGVVAFEGSKFVYQTRPLSVTDRGAKTSKTDIGVSLCRVDADGNLTGSEMSLAEMGCSGRRIIGVNQNRRLMKLEKYVEMLTPDSICDVIKHFIGDGAPIRLLSEINSVPPSTFYELNAEQQTVAHPLKLLSAKEVAGPPGTGKTKTIAEVIRGIMECTDYDVIILSERNAAIDAIAQKFALDCLKMNSSGGKCVVRDIKLWGKVMAFGCEGSMGPSAMKFTLSLKMK